MQRLASQIMITGCGPVGLTLANCLVRSPFIDSITLLDRKVPAKTRQLPPVSSQRVYSITGPSLKLFQSLQILPSIRQKGRMSQVQVVSKQSLSFTNWTENQANVMQNDQIIYAHMKQLSKPQYSKKIQFIQDQVQRFERTPQNCIVELKNNKQQIQTKLLVGSDGITSSIKRLAGIPHYGWQYRQKAIVCTMKIDEGIINTAANQIYHDSNVLAILPLWDNYVSLVWSLGLPDFDYLMSLKDQQFKNKLNNVIRNSNNSLFNKAGYNKIPQIQQIVNKRLSFPLSTMQSSTYTGERVALIGDAAHNIHPMAGLGVNSGFMDSVLLANNIIRNIKTGNDIGDLMSLSDYQAKAKAFNYANSLAMEGMKKMFQTDSSVINKLRGIGMAFAQGNSLIKQAMKNMVGDSSPRFEWEAN